MLETSDLEGNVLEFLHKSFGFERLAAVGGTEYAVFSRRETESESKLRPRIIRLFVVAPRAAIVHELSADLLLLAPDGIRPGPRTGAPAREADAEPTAFEEQGFAWRRVGAPAGIVYLPAEAAETLAAPAALIALGLAEGPSAT
ncbi:MAG TPA: hypothetical protein VMH78_02040 [Thermoplasmata archaeon]|nr:hypothetical protein [Thermoplasmata archaeon]